MKKKIVGSILFAVLWGVTTQAQFIVNDPINVATSIGNTVKEIVTMP